MQKIRIALLGTDWNANENRIKNNLYGGVTYYRLIKPLLDLEGYDVEYHGADLQELAKDKDVPQFWEEMMSRFDIFIIKAIDNPEAASPLMFFAQKYGKKVILDLDDNLFEVKPDQPAWEYYKPESPKRAIFSALLSLVDGLFVSTQPLKDYYTKYLKEVFNKEIPIFVLPNYNDKKDFNFIPGAKNEDKIIISWIGSTTHFNDLKIVIPAMTRLMKEYLNLEFQLVGGLTHEDAPTLFKDMDESVLDRVFCGSGTESWQGYPEFLSKQQWDIGIAPLTQDEFNRGKSHIKWMEYASYAIPCVASRVYPYHMPILEKETIVDGVTGMLCDDKEWYRKLKKLIDNKDLREQIGKNAQEYVFKELQYKDHKHLWLDAVSKFSVEK